MQASFLKITTLLFVSSRSGIVRAGYKPIRYRVASRCVSVYSGKGRPGQKCDEIRAIFACHFNKAATSETNLRKLHDNIRN